MYGISLGGGFIVLTGEVGTGKTTLCRCLMEQLPEDVDIALIFNPRLNARELLASICDELNIPHSGDRTSIKRLIDRLNHHLLETHARGRRTIVLIDEAQNLSYDVLEQIRLLTNLETNETKLLQIILVGQPELNVLLARTQLRQLSQRVTARYHLMPLSQAETEAYINHRLTVSGVNHRIFSRLAVARIYRLSKGIPRLVNLICDRALLGAYTLGKMEVGRTIVGKAAREVLPRQRQKPARLLIAALAGLALFSIAVGSYFHPTSFPTDLRKLLDAARLDQIRPVAQQPATQPGGAAKSSIQAGNSPDPREQGRLGMEEAKPIPKAKELNAGAPVLPAEPHTEPLTRGSEWELGETSETGFGKMIEDASLTRRAAFSRLYTLWGGTPPQGEYDECLAAKQMGLRCLFSKGDAPLLAKLNRPAVLELVLPDGSNRYATLLRLEEKKWVLAMANSDIGLEPEQLLHYWQGNFILLWKPPSSMAGINRLGKNNKAVRWTRLQLNEPAAPGKESFFDVRLKQKVMDFQRKNGLLADGEVGPLTVIQLEKASPQYEGPSLIKIKE